MEHVIQEGALSPATDGSTDGGASSVPAIGSLFANPAVVAAGDARARRIAGDPEPLSPRNQGFC